MQTLANWPPSIPGSCKWWASLQGRRLVLAHCPEQAADDPSQQHKGEGNATRAPAPAPKEALVIREIDLEGCRCAGSPAKCADTVRQGPTESRHFEIKSRELFQLALVTEVSRGVLRS